MRNVITIAGRELRGYFDSPVAYIVVATFLLLTGWMFFSPFFLMGQADLRRLYAPEFLSPATLLVIFAPAVTMRLVAEERRSGTLELLATLPIKDSEIIVGKFLAAFGLLMSGLVLTFIYALTVTALGDLDWGPVFSGFLGISLFAGALLAVGLFTSTITDNQIVAFIVGVMICAVLYFVNWLQFFLPQDLATLFEYSSVSYHLGNMARGVIDLRNVFYYLTLIGGALFVSVQSLKRLHA